MPPPPADLGGVVNHKRDKLAENQDIWLTPHTLRNVKNRGFRTFLSILAGLAVIYLGSSQPDGSHQVTNALLVLGGITALIVWNLTKPTNKPVS